jgi:hypothetical protein
VSIFGTLVFLFQERGELAGWQQKHLANVTAAIKDALPIVERYRQRVSPDNETVKQVEAALHQVTVDPASPMQGEPFSPTNPNPNAG